MTAAHSEYLPAILAAIGTTGLAVRHGPVHGDELIAGVRIERGGLTVDRDRLRYAGDVLHEAGHLAVLPPAERAAVAGVLPAEGAQETAVLAWSYAAALAFDLPLDVVFHDGFKAGGPWLRETFAGGDVLGQPMLQHWGMTRLVGTAEPADLPVYPEMGCWLRAW